MAAENVETILRGIQIGQQRKSDKERQGLEQQRIDAEAEARKQAHEITLKQLDLNERHTNAVIDQLKAAAALKVLEARQSAVQNLAQGIPVAGATSQPGMDNLGNPVPRTLPSGASTTPVQQNITMPEALGGGTEVAPTPTEFAKGQADLKSIALRPEIEKAKEVATAAEAERIKRQKELDDANYERAMAQKVWDYQIAQLHADSAERIAKGHDAALKWVQSQKSSLPEGWEGTDFSPYISDALAGKTSREDFSRMQLPKPVKTAIELGVKTAGGNFIDAKQQQDIAQYAPVLDIVQTMDELLGKLPQTDAKGKMSRLKTAMAGLGSTFDADIRSLKERLDGQSTMIGRVVSKDNRVSDLDAKKVGSAYFPSEFDTYENNVKKRNDFVRKVGEALDARLGTTVSPQQRDMIKSRLGLSTIPPYQIKQGQQQTQGQQTQTPTVYNWTPQGLVPAGK